MSRLTLPNVFAALLIGTTSAVAGPYSPDEPVPFKVGPDGVAEEIPYLPDFKSMLVDRLNAANPKTPTTTADGKSLTYRGQVLARVERLWPKAKTLPPAEQAGLAADLIRVGRAGDAVNLLDPRLRDRVPDYRAVATLAHAHAARQEWDEATRALGIALFDAEPPSELPGAAPAQVKWRVQVERTYYRRWLRLRQQEAAGREPVEEQDVYPLFPAGDGGTPVRFVNEQGQYEPGSLAAAEKAKLPPDAVAIVQQLLLWSPDDTRMLWLLGELYAAAGRLREANDVFEQCTWGRGFTNRKKLMDHRRAVQVAAEKQPQPAVPDLSLDPAPADKPDGSRFLPDRSQVMVIGGVFGVVALVLGALQVRAIVRRYRGHRPPRG